MLSSILTSGLEDSCDRGRPAVELMVATSRLEAVAARQWEDGVSSPGAVCC